MATMFLAFIAASAVCGEPQIYSCKFNGTNATLTQGFVADADAWASWDNASYTENGWGKIHIWTNASRPSYNQMYCAGYVDTSASFKRVNESYHLFREAQLCEEAKEGHCTQNMRADWPAAWSKWIGDNIRYVRKMANLEDDYWKRTRLILAQVDGMLDGFNAQAGPGNEITEIDWWMLQSGGDLDDLGVIYPVQGLIKDPEFTLKCTGLVKLAPGNEDIWFAQDTWSDVRDLHAYLKEYNLNIPEFKSHRVMISTRTGHLASVDDFWVNDQGLVVMETTMHNFNQTLYDNYVKPQSVMTWMRSYHAMFATDNGKDWADHFIRENSGTYNNEYLILDTKLFKPGEAELDDSLLWMIEQYPGNYHSESVTKSRLAPKTFVQSINTPWFDDMWSISNYSGQQKAEPAKADFWSYDKQLRNLIIERDAGNLSSYEEFQTFMRYNDYEHDPLQIIPDTGEKEPAQGILARYDLRPDNGTAYGAKNHFAGLDSKTVSVNTLKASRTFDAINSPKYDGGIPAFSFRDWPKISHDGLPETFQYPWTNFTAVDHCVVFGGENDKDKCYEIVGCGFCMYNQKCWSGNKEGPDAYFGYECENGWGVKTVSPEWAVPVVASVSSIVFVFLVIVYVLHFVNAKKNQYARI